MPPLRRRPRRPSRPLPLRQKPRADAAPAPAAAADAPKPPSINKGDTAFMYVATIMVILMTIPGLALFLRRPGPLEEHAVGADAGVRGLRADHGALGDLRLLGGLHRRLALLRRPVEDVPVWRDAESAAATFSKETYIPS